MSLSTAHLPSPLKQAAQIQIHRDKQCYSSAGFLAAQQCTQTQSSSKKKRVGAVVQVQKCEKSATYNYQAAFL